MVIGGDEVVQGGYGSGEVYQHVITDERQDEGLNWLKYNQLLSDQ